MIEQERMKRMVAVMQDYWNTYDEQYGYENYSDKTFLLDALYGIGLALDRDKYYTATGFDRFKEFLKVELLEGEE